MPNNIILSEFSASDISAFKKDFTQIIKAGAEIDRNYGKAEHVLDDFIPKYEKLLQQFNRKYKGIGISIKKTIESCKVRVFLKIKSMKDFFAESASRIPGLKSVGRANFNQIDAGDAEKFAKFLDSLLDRICISYVDPDSGTSTIAAVLDRSKKMVELIYSPSEIINENSAGFKISAFYALKEGYDKKIDVYSTALAFGFSSLLNESEKVEWHDKFKR